MTSVSTQFAWGNVPKAKEGPNFTAHRNLNRGEAARRGDKNSGGNHQTGKERGKKASSRK